MIWVEEVQQVQAVAAQLFYDGYTEMQKCLKPKKIIFYGNVPDWIDKDKDNIISIGSYQDKFRV